MLPVSTPVMATVDPSLKRMEILMALMIVVLHDGDATTVSRRNNKGMDTSRWLENRQLQTPIVRCNRGGGASSTVYESSGWGDTTARFAITRRRKQAEGLTHPDTTSPQQLNGEKNVCSVPTNAAHVTALASIA